jgi:RNA polymerase sigma factor (sigma-70 family)
MGMARGETSGDRDEGDVRGESVAAVATPASEAYDAHGEALRLFLVRHTRDAAAAEDLAHEAFVRLLTESAAGRGPLNVRAWLFRVGMNLVASRARHRGVAARHADALADRATAPSPEELLLDREASLALTDLLAGLPGDARAAMLLTAHGYSGAEIARHIGRTELATRSMLCRQRTRLRSIAAA